MRPLGSASSLLSSIRPRAGRYAASKALQRAAVRTQNLHTTPPRHEEDERPSKDDQIETTPSQKASIDKHKTSTKTRDHQRAMRQPAEPRIPFRKLTAEERRLITDERRTVYKRYSDKEKAELKAKYTLEQYESIVAADEAVRSQDLSTGQTREDVLAPRQFDSAMYARIQPTIDKRPERIRGEWDNIGDKDKFKGRHRDEPNEEKKMARIMDILTDTRYNPHDALERRREAVHNAIRNDQPVPPPGDHGKRDRTLGKQLGQLLGTTNRQARAMRKKLYANAAEEEADEKADPGTLDEEGAALQADKRRVIDTEDESALDREVARIERELASEPDGPAPKKSTRQRLEDAMNWRVRSTPEVAPDIPYINDPKVVWESPAEQEAAQQASGLDDETVEALARLSKTIGLPVSQLREFRTKVLVGHRVVNQTRLGKIASQYILCVAGDGDGLVGLGEGKAFEMETAVRTARLAAIRNMRPVLRYEARTIFGHVRGKVGATELTLRAAPPGFGLRLSGRLFEIARAAGIYDLGGAVTRARNPMNTCKAMLQALTAQRDPEDIARARGRKLVDVRRVYYAGCQ